MKKWKIYAAYAVIELFTIAIIVAVLTALAHACGYYFEKLSLTGAFWCGAATVIGIHFIEDILDVILPDSFNRIREKKAELKKSISKE